MDFWHPWNISRLQESVQLFGLTNWPFKLIRTPFKFAQPEGIQIQKIRILANPDHMQTPVMRIDSLSTNSDTDPVQHFKWIRIRIWVWIQSFDDQKYKNYTAEIFEILFIDQKLKKASIKDDQTTGEAFSPQKRTSSTSRDEIYPSVL